MRTIFLLAFIVVIGLLPQSAKAFYPVDGWWWNPHESGRGFNIEMQDDIMFISAFHYRPNGDPVWWVASGQYNHNTGTLVTEFLELANGQCAGCPYSGFPDLLPGAGSPVTVVFDTAISGTLHWDGESIPIQRQYWYFNINQPETYLLGEFHFTSGALGVYFGQRLYFNQTVDNGFVGGRVRSGGSNRVAVGQLDDNLALFSILVDSSSSYYQLYVFDMTKDRMEGINWTFLKTDEPSGGGLPFIGHRVASRAYVQSGVGPHELQSSGSSSSLSIADHSFLEQDRQRSAVQRELQSRKLMNPNSTSSLTSTSATAVDEIDVLASFQILRSQMLHSQSNRPGYQ